MNSATSSSCEGSSERLFSGSAALLSDFDLASCLVVSGHASEFCDRFVGAFRESLPASLALCLSAARLLLNAVFDTVFLSLSAPSSFEVLHSALGFATRLWTWSSRSHLRDRVPFGSSLFSLLLYVRVSCLDVVVAEMLLSFVQFSRNSLSSVVGNASACSGPTPFVCELLVQVRHHVT